MHEMLLPPRILKEAQTRIKVVKEWMTHTGVIQTKDKERKRQNQRVRERRPKVKAAGGLVSEEQQPPQRCPDLCLTRVGSAALEKPGKYRF